MRSRSGKRLAARRRQGDRERRRERDDAAHAGEGQRERPLPGRRGIGASDGGNEPARQVDRGKCPDEARDDDDGGDQQRRGRKLGNRIVSDVRHDRARLKAGDQEQHALDQIDQEIPEEDALQPGRRADQAKAVPAHVEADRHRRQHARAAEMLRRPEGDERRQNRKRDLDARVTHPAPQPQHQPTDADPPDDSPATIALKASVARPRENAPGARPRPRRSGRG